MMMTTKPSNNGTILLKVVQAIMKKKELNEMLPLEKEKLILPLKN